MGISVVLEERRKGPRTGVDKEVRASSVVLLPHAPSSVAIARKRLCTDLQASGLHGEIVDDANVIVSELVSNALRHARPLPSGHVQVAWHRAGDGVELSVSDGGAMTEPRRGRPALSSLGGRGLGIVEALSDRWGVRHEDGHTTVWAIVRTATVAEPAVEAASPPLTTGLLDFPDVSGDPTANLLNGTR